jgi:protein phosphatase 2C family protein 2/3
MLGLKPDDTEIASQKIKNGKDIVLPNFERTKCSVRRNGVVRAYAANTHQGLVRSYNEDRVAIIMNIVQPESRKHEVWPDTLSFFGIYDGHGGHKCAEYLSDTLHQFVIKDKSFPSDPKQALRSGFAAAEKAYFE